MAGLIAGKDSDLTAPYANAPASVYRGMAPDARIVSLKVGDPTAAWTSRRSSPRSTG